MGYYFFKSRVGGECHRRTKWPRIIILHADDRWNHYPSPLCRLRAAANLLFISGRLAAPKDVILMNDWSPTYGIKVQGSVKYFLVLSLHSLSFVSLSRESYLLYKTSYAWSTPHRSSVHAISKDDCEGRY